MGMRKDIVIATGEKFPDAITGESVLLFAASKNREHDLKINAYLQQNSAVINNQVYAMGDDTFRLDYYSASNLLARIKELFGQSNDAK